MPTTSRKTVNTSYQILGIQVDTLTIEAAINQIVAKAATGDSPASYVVKPYVEFLERCITEPELITLLNDAEWCLPDGIALNWAAHYLYGGRHNILRLFGTLAQIVLMPRRLKHEIPDRFGGTNFTWPLLESAAKNQLKVYLIGSPKHQDISDTARLLEDKIPGLQLCGYASGQLDTRLEHNVTAELQRLRPDLILVGMGFPLQEELIVRLMANLEHGILIGEGGTFDYQQFGGGARKAPALMQKIGLEWLWRLILEPSRLKRQLSIPRYIWHVYGQGRDLDQRSRA
jgi:N-acetylglucosaminyldiphosphoundecaprenol N-acetyl-beta-D-mannosaminyltransferase